MAGHDDDRRTLPPTDRLSVVAGTGAGVLLVLLAGLMIARVVHEGTTATGRRALAPDLVNTGNATSATAIGDSHRSGEAASRRVGQTRTVPNVQSATFDPPLRVRLTEAAVTRGVLGCRSAFVVRSHPEGRELERLPFATALVVELAEADDRGVPVWRIGQSSFRAAGLEVTPINPGAIEWDSHRYRGVLRFVAAAPQGTAGGASRFFPVNVVPVEQYLYSVVDSEMPADFGASAREAQAILARSYARYAQAEQSGNSIGDVFASVRSQRYHGLEYRDSRGRRLAGESESSRRVVDQTRGLVLTYRGQLFQPFYSAACGGRTTSSAQVFPRGFHPPHQSVACDQCQACPLYRWKRSLPDERFRTALAQAARVPAKTLRKAPLRMKGEAGREVATIEWTGPTAGQAIRTGSISGAALRQHLAEVLPSPRFAGHLTESGWVLEGGGHGHGVGLCQWGARQLASEGHDARAILSFYYRDVTIAPWTPPKPR